MFSGITWGNYVLPFGYVYKGKKYKLYLISIPQRSVSDNLHGYRSKRHTYRLKPHIYELQSGAFLHFIIFTGFNSQKNLQAGFVTEISHAITPLSTHRKDETFIITLFNNRTNNYA
jgi:hypothetical protein